VIVGIGHEHRAVPNRGDTRGIAKACRRAATIRGSGGPRGFRERGEREDSHGGKQRRKQGGDHLLIIG
jgi:hypothetical protein